MRLLIISAGWVTVQPKVFQGRSMRHPLFISFQLVVALFVVGCTGGAGLTNTCEGVDCAGHGQCVIGSETYLCVCEDGFVFQDGTCKEAPEVDACSGIVCAGDGICAVASGDTPVCVCRPGYQSDGAACVATGEPCGTDACSGHGACVVTTSGSLCICDTGYAANGLACEPVADPCAGVTCDGEGFCVASVGGPMCVCNPGFVSESGRCLPEGNVCVDVDCNGLGTCVESGNGSPVCICGGESVAVGLSCVAAPEGAIPEISQSNTEIAEVHPDVGAEYVPGELVVYAVEQHDAAALMAAIVDLGGRITAYQPAVRRYQVSFDGPPTAAELSAIVESLAALADVSVVDYVWISNPDEINEPNDTGWGPVSWDDSSVLESNWPLKMISAPDVWAVTTGTKKIKVGVIDFGDPGHSDLSFKAKLLRSNPGTSTHGRETSGVLAAVGNNSTGLTGVLWNADLYYCEADGTDTGFFECMKALLKLGIKVINYSAGTRFRVDKCGNAEPWTCPFSAGMEPELNGTAMEVRAVRQQVWNAELKALNKYDWILVQAAGNEALANAAFAAVSMDVDEPSVKDRILTVGALTSSGAVSPFSNQGSLDIAAPGGDGSTTRDITVLGSSTRKAGTSYSAPYVTGVAALAWSVYPELSSVEIVDAVLDGSRTAAGVVGDLGGNSYPMLDAMGVIDRILAACASDDMTFDPATDQCIGGCLADCTGKSCGDDDGCGGQCFGVAMRRCESGVLWTCDTRPQETYVDCVGIDKECLWDAPRSTYNCLSAANPSPAGAILLPGDQSTVTGNLSIVAHVVDDTAVAKATVVISGPTGVEVSRKSVLPGVADYQWNVDTISTAMWSSGSYTIGLWALDADNPALLVDSATINFSKGTCIPDCAGRECGSDGCGGQCTPGCGGGVCLANGHCSAVTSGCSNGWCLIPAGTFQMGSPDTEPCRSSNEGPVHDVTITRSFYMKQTEVTQGEWEALVGNNPSSFQSCGTDCPVEYVNWYDAVYYANLLSDAEGFDLCYTIQNCSGTPGNGLSCSVNFKGLECNGYRLPTEAESEYAARAGTDTAYWSGGNVGLGGVEICGSGDPFGINLPEVAWYGFNSGSKTHPVAELLANAFGLYDVHGNVWEWTNDWYGSDYYTTCADGCTDPLGPAGSARVVRGGSWNGDANNARSANRDRSSPTNRIHYYGFRLSRSIP